MRVEFAVEISLPFISCIGWSPGLSDRRGVKRPGFTGEFFVQNLRGFFKGVHIGVVAELSP